MLSDRVGLDDSFTLSQLQNMMRPIHDQFAKHWLAELLQPVGGRVETQRELSGEIYRADVSVEPSPTAPGAAFQQLGLLGQMVKQACLVEYFWPPPTHTEIRSSLLKLFEVHNELYRQKDKGKVPPDQKPLRDEELPQLWILTTSASEALLNACGAKCQPPSWEPGIYFKDSASF